MTATIRPATPSDALRLAELRYEFRSPRAANTESREEFLERCTAWMQAHLASGRWFCWVAVRDERIVGHVWLNLLEKIPNPVAEAESHGYITNMYVQEASRGGVGGALMDAALAFCARREVDSIILWPTQRSRSLYQKKGFSATGSIMSRQSRQASP
jgi:GNAT superfamily N-acetyltransferase